MIFFFANASLLFIVVFLSGRAKLAAEPPRHRTLFPELFIKPKKNVFEREETSTNTMVREDSSVAEMA